MTTPGSEKIKLYLVLLLALMAAVVAYFRFIHKGGGAVAKIVQTPAAQVKPDPAAVKTVGSQRVRTFRLPLRQPLDGDIRDIFRPLQLPNKPEPAMRPKPSVRSEPVEKRPAAAPPPAPPLTVELKGIVIGGNEPLAIINDKFVRVGEKIGDYQVVDITPTAVYFKADKHQKVIHVMAGAAP